MNLLVSYDWLKEYVAFKGSAAELAKRLSLGGPSVERLYPQAGLFDRMVAGTVKEVRPHPNADKLRVAVTDLGSRTADIVCGGSNLEAGMRVAVALEGAMVRWHGEGEPMALKSADIRGVKSEGMICGASEIGLADVFPHAEREIMDIGWTEAKPGTPLASALGLEDVLMDVEVTSNRPDAFSIVGLGREAAAITGSKFLWKPSAMLKPAKGLGTVTLSAKVLAPHACTRYQAAVMDGVKVGQSPWWMKKRLRSAGIRPINVVVDITNYVMLELGQPMHAFDHAKLEGAALAVRAAKEGERLLALDGKTYALSAGQLVIADATKPVAVAGIMGGEYSAVHQDTTTVVFESATFDPVAIRRTARALNLRSDSSQRFEKGLPEEQTSPALSRAVGLCAALCGGRLAGKPFDLQHVRRKSKALLFDPRRAAAVIGVDIPAAQMTKVLLSLGFSLKKQRLGAFSVFAPYWRARDIEGERDLVEEVARVYGYHRLPAISPAGPIPLGAEDALLAGEGRMKRFFRAAGFTELLTYSFVSEAMLASAGVDPAVTVRVANPLSADFVCMRPSLVPSALTAVKENQGIFPEGRVFELANIYVKRDGAHLPEERPQFVAMAYGRAADDAAFRSLKGALVSWCAEEGVALPEMARLTDDKWMHSGRSVALSRGGKTIGMLGELHPSLLEAMGVDGRATALVIDLADAYGEREARARYHPVAAFPPVLRDAAFVIAESAEYASVVREARAAAPLLTDVGLFDVYRGKGIDPGKKSVALHLTFSQQDRTLTAEEADNQLAAITKALAGKFGAALRA